MQDTADVFWDNTQNMHFPKIAYVRDIAKQFIKVHIPLTDFGDWTYFQRSVERKNIEKIYGAYPDSMENIKINVAHAEELETVVHYPIIGRVDEQGHETRHADICLYRVNLKSRGIEKEKTFLEVLTTIIRTEYIIDNINGKTHTVYLTRPEYKFKL